MTLFSIVLATLIGGVASVLIAATLSLGTIAKIVKQMVSLSVGLLLGSAILNVLPEAINSGANVDGLAWVFLSWLLLVISLEKIAIFRHSHHHEGDGHEHHHGHDHMQAGHGGYNVLIGDSVHNLTDGVMIAAAFLVDHRLGWITALSVLTHEIPQEIGDFVVLVNAGYSKAKALLFNAISGAACVLGGILGYFVLEQTTALLPYALMVTVASFLYVALADLIPSMQASSGWKDSLQRFSLLGVGILIVCIVKMFHQH